METIKVLWTGGFDSTFRIAQLSKYECIIEPYYISDNRRSESNELNAIKSIISILVNKNDTKCTFKQLQIVKSSEVPPNLSITNAYKDILKTDFFGSQYDWLARYAAINPGLELSIHKDDKALKIINKYGRLIHVNRNGFSYYVIDKEKSDSRIVQLFGNYHIPLINYTKIEMRKEYEKLGLVEVSEKTWFCYTPINNKPCGKCNPCKYTIEEGLTDRFTKDALRRYKIKKIVEKFKRIPLANILLNPLKFLYSKMVE